MSLAIRERHRLVVGVCLEDNPSEIKMKGTF
jgi:hypothetical protein